MRRLILCGALVLVFVAGWAARSAHAQAERHGDWTNEACMTNGCIKDVLDRLPPDRAHDAKLTTWHSTTYVWYRK